VTDAVYTELHNEQRSTVPLSLRPQKLGAVVQEELGPAVWDAVVEAGVKGDLDEFLMQRASVDETALCKQIIDQANAALGRKVSMPLAMAKPLLTPLRDFVRAHPFQDGAGRYFCSHNCSHLGGG
jgi:hypothetical protein